MMTEAFFYGMFAGLVLSAIVIYWISKFARRRLEREVQQLIEQIKDQAGPQIQARVEEQDGVFYVYRADDNTFLAQGTTLAELKSRIESRMKDAMVYVTEGDPEVLARLKSTNTEATNA